MNKQIEVEGSELLLQSKEGHYAVIPATHRDTVGSMIDAGMDDQVNSYINTLPKESNYAEDGTLIEGGGDDEGDKNPPPATKNWIYPSSWNVDDMDGAYLDGKKVRVISPSTTDEYSESFDAKETQKYRGTRYTKSYNKKYRYGRQPGAKEELGVIQSMIDNAKGVRYEQLGEDHFKRPLANVEYQLEGDDTWHRWDSTVVAHGAGIYQNYTNPNAEGKSFQTSAKSERQLGIEAEPTTVPYTGRFTPGEFKYDGVDVPTLSDMDRVLDAVRMTESRGGKHLGPSTAGALGEYQFMPATAANPGYGIKPFDPKDPVASRKAAKQYLLGMMSKHGFTLQESLQAYNMGPGNMLKVKAGKMKMPKESYNYIHADDSKAGVNPGILFYGGYDMDSAYRIEESVVENKRANAIRRLGPSNFNKLSPEQQAEIMGSPKGSMSGATIFDRSIGEKVAPVDQSWRTRYDIKEED